jgi:thioredoxin-related protein
VKGRIFSALGVSILGWLLVAGCTADTVREGMDASLPLKDFPAVDLNGAMAQAAAENKMVLLDFTGSDWCGPCMQLHKRVLEQPEFKSYAGSNLVFLVVDFPARYRLPDAVAATNNFLAAKFGVHAFPTLVALDGQGKKVWRQVGFMPWTRAKSVIAALDGVKGK